MTSTSFDSAALLKAVIEDAPDCAFIVLDHSGIIHRWNCGAVALFGHEAEQVIGRHFATLFTIEDVRAGVPETELRTAARDGSTEDARWHVRADGTRFFASGVTSVFKDVSGNVSGYVKLARDGTARKRAEEERERMLVREKQLNREKDTFFAAVSHELRTPLTALGGWLALIERSAEDPQVVREGLPNIKQSLDMLGKLVNDLLDTVRAGSAKMEVNQKRVDLAPIVSAAVRAFRQQWEAAHLTVREALADHITVMGDPTRLHQVVANLVTNAIRHTPGGGSVEVALRADDGHAVIEVRDSGGGIDPTFLPYIFEPFRQKTGGGEGLGLGLAIARSLVEAHGGTIAAESEGIGRGATFRVSVPLATPSASR